MGFEIRHAELEDDKALLELWHGFTAHLSEFDDRYEHKPDADERWHSYFENQLIDAKYGTVIVAETAEADDPVGVLEARVRGNHPIFQLENHGYVTGLFVREDYRRRGIGSALLDAAAEWFAEVPRNVDYFRIDALTADDATKAMYEACGLKPVETVYEMRLD